MNLIVNEGKIVDASFIKVPKQRNRKEENQLIKNGETPYSFNENPHKKLKKMLMHDGQKRIMKRFLDMKTT